VTVTAYTPYESSNTTSTGKQVKEGYIAASRDLVKKWGYGSTIMIDGIGVFELEDTMSNKYKNRIDVFMYDHSDAIEFGIKKNIDASKIGDI
jgi:3D (Asp-Asp-Asp) domain-containing protein